MATKKKPAPTEETVTIRNLHNGKECPMPKSQWEKQRLSLKGKFEIVKAPPVPPEVKKLKEKQSAKTKTEALAGADQASENQSE